MAAFNGCSNLRWRGMARHLWLSAELSSDALSNSLTEAWPPGRGPWLARPVWKRTGFVDFMAAAGTTPAAGLLIPGLASGAARPGTTASAGSQRAIRRQMAARSPLRTAVKRRSGDLDGHPGKPDSHARLIGQNREMLSAGSAVAFRDATLSDALAIVSLVQSAYRGEASRDGWTTEADLIDGNRIDPDTVREVVSAPRSVIMLAYQKPSLHRTTSADHGDIENPAFDELSACCQLADEGESTGYFGLFAVRPDRQGTGLGRAVLAEAERRAVTEWRCSMLRMLVIRQRADLIAWYLRLGFALTGRTSPFPYGDERFGLPKRPDLEFVELRKQLGQILSVQTASLSCCSLGAEYR
jgi:GNAT superfamily N-acetyltransferase